jgi:putative redox protein
MYARRKKWPLESMTVELEHSRVHARDCEACESDEGFVDWIDMSVTLSGELSEEQRTRLFEISGRCPVKRTLQGEVLIQPRLVSKGAL